MLIYVSSLENGYKVEITDDELSQRPIMSSGHFISQAAEDMAAKCITGIGAFKNYQSKFQWKQVSIRIPTAIYR